MERYTITKEDADFILQAVRTLEVAAVNWSRKAPKTRGLALTQKERQEAYERLGNRVQNILCNAERNLE